jgi:uncharacterized peroxidase-related enzyme
MGIPKPLAKEQAPAELHKIYDKMQEDIGRMPNIFGVVARFPAALKTLVLFYDAVLSKGKIEAKYKELAYLKTSIINECRYWILAHTASAKQAGVTDKQIQELGFYRRSEAFDEKEKITIRFADIVTRGATAVDPAVLEYVGRYYSEDEIVELTMVIALANLVNRINDTLQIEPDLGVKDAE